MLGFAGFLLLAGFFFAAFATALDCPFSAAKVKRVEPDQGQSIAKRVFAAQSDKRKAAAPGATALFLIRLEQLCFPDLADA